MTSFVRISALLWADILVTYAFFMMQNYLTDVWKLSFTHVAGILNIWGGLSLILPVFFLFLADAILGHFTMLVLSSLAYTVGIGFVTMSTPPTLAKITGTCKTYEPQCIGRVQKVLFYSGMALVAVGVAGHLVSVYPFGDQQKVNPQGKNQSRRREVLKLPVVTVVFIVPIVGAIALPYINPWDLRFGIPAVCTAFSTLLFLTGWCEYKKDQPQGSPLANVCRVFVAVVLKRSEQIPGDIDRLYTKDQQSFSRTRFLRCLEKAAVVSEGVNLEDQVKKRWRLCSVSEVEDAKIAVRMAPMWLTFIMCGVVSSIGNTFFVEQANHMDRNLGAWRVPLPIFLLLSGWAKKFFFVPLANHYVLKTFKQYGPSIGIGIAMVFSTLCCIAAARVETRRIRVLREHNLVQMSVFWLLFQYFLLAGLDSFLDKGVAAFYEDQSPQSMRSYLGLFTKGVSGLGQVCAVVSVYAVGKVSEMGGRRNWFQYTLHRSRLDRYYWVLAGLSSLNLVVFVFVASCFRYKDGEEAGDDGRGGEGLSGLPSEGGRL